MTAKRYEPSPFFVLRHETANEVWIDASGAWVSDLKEAQRLSSPETALLAAVELSNLGMHVEIEDFDDAQRRTVRLHAEGGK